MNPTHDSVIIIKSYHKHIRKRGIELTQKILEDPILLVWKKMPQRIHHHITKRILGRPPALERIQSPIRCQEPFVR